jgi:hypothetical protein
MRSVTVFLSYCGFGVSYVEHLGSRELLVTGVPSADEVVVV